MKILPVPKTSTLFSQIIIGMIGAIVDFVILIILLKFLKFEIAFFIGISFAIFVNYVLTIKYSFKSLNKIKKKKNEVIYYYLSYCATILTQILVIYGLQNLGLDIVYSKIIAIAASFLISFYLKFIIIFGKNSEK